MNEGEKTVDDQAAVLAWARRMYQALKNSSDLGWPIYVPDELYDTLLEAIDDVPESIKEPEKKP